MSAGQVSAADLPLDAAAIAEATAHYAAPRAIEGVLGESAVVFRIGGEWLALPTATLDRIADPQPVHSLPHRRSGAPAGLVNVGGDLVVHVSLGNLLNVQAGARSDAGESTRSVARLLVLTDQRGRLAITVDEVWGVYRYDASARKAMPASAGGLSTYTSAILDVDGRTVGYLDVNRVMSALSTAIS